MMFYRPFLVFVFLIAGPLVWMARSFAQESAEPSPLCLSPDFYGSLLQNVGTPTLVAAQRSVLGNAGPSPVPRMRRDGVTETLVANLDYRPSAGISRTLRQQIAVNVEASDPEPSSEIRNVLSNDAMWQRFDHLLRQSGYNARNLADVMAAYYVSAWEIVHRASAAPSDSRAARDRIAGSLQRSPEIMFMSDAEKQRSAETFGILTTVSTAGSESLLQHNDWIGYATLQDRVHEVFLQQGVDLKRLTLDSYGFASH